MVKILHSQCRGPGVRSLVRELDSTCHNQEFARCNEYRRSCVLQLRASADKERKKEKYLKNKYIMKQMLLLIVKLWKGQFEGVGNTKSKVSICPCLNCICTLLTAWCYNYVDSFVCVCVCVWVLVAQSCLTLWDPTDCSPPDFSVHGILQARMQEWIAIHFSRGTSQPRDWTLVSCITDRFFTVWATVANFEHC